MKRQTREGIIRTALVTANAKYGWDLAHADEVITRICDAEEEQERRDEATKDEFLREAGESHARK